MFDAEEVRLGRDPGFELFPLDHGPIRIHRLGIQKRHGRLPGSRGRQNETEYQRVEQGSARRRQTAAQHLAS